MIHTAAPEEEEEWTTEMLTSTSFGVESKPDNPVLRAVWVPGDRGCSWCAARSSSSHNCPLQPGWLQALEVVCGRGGSGGFPGQGSVKNHRFSFSEFYLPSPEKANLCKPLILKYQRPWASVLLQASVVRNSKARLNISPRRTSNTTSTCAAQRAGRAPLYFQMQLHTQSEILFQCLPRLRLAIERNRLGHVGCLLRLCRRLSSCAAQIRKAMRSLLATHLT